MEEKELQVEEVEAVAEVVDEHNKEGFIYLKHQIGNKRLFFYVEKDTPTNVAFDGALDIAMHLRELLREQIKDGMKKAEQEMAQKEAAEVSA